MDMHASVSLCRFLVDIFNMWIPNQLQFLGFCLNSGNSVGNDPWALPPPPKLKFFLQFDRTLSELNWYVNWVWQPPFNCDLLQMIEFVSCSVSVLFFFFFFSESKRKYMKIQENTFFFSKKLCNFKYFKVYNCLDFFSINFSDFWLQ